MRLDLSVLPVPAAVPVVPISQNHGWEQTRKAETLATQGFAESVPVVPIVPMQKQQRETRQAVSQVAGHAAVAETGQDASLAPTHLATKPTRNVVVRFKLREGGGGQVIDPDGIPSAVADLLDRFGSRLDGADLLDWLATYARHDKDAATDEAEAAMQAAEIIRQAQSKTTRRAP